MTTEPITSNESLAKAAPTSGIDPVAISHAANYHRRYPGDPVTFLTRLSVQADLNALVLTVHVPPGLDVTGTMHPDQFLTPPTLKQEAIDGTRLTWSWTSDRTGEQTRAQPIPKGSVLEFEVYAMVSQDAGRADLPRNLDCDAEVSVTRPIGAISSYRRRVTIRVVWHVRLCHIADTYRRYPGERVTFYTRIEALVDLSALDLSIYLPAGLDMIDSRAPRQLQNPAPTGTAIGNGSRLTWTAKQDIPKGTCWEFQLDTVVSHHVAQGDADNLMACEAEARATTAGGKATSDDQSASIAVAPKASYLKYLPSIYRDDDLMSRFLMLFESFWSPIETQITQTSYYLDPMMTPVDLLPWLASWADLALDEHWPEAKKRRLLRSIVSLYRRRGTRRGLEEMLEIYTGVKPMISEHRANNLTLGESARLGPSIALGKSNIPYSFSVSLHLPALASGSGTQLPQGELLLLEEQRRHTIERIIESEKPAHTRYQLEIVPA